MLPKASLSDIPDDVQREIQARLAAIERDENVRIVLAVESGSRAWGFASADSDYDVRFIYVRRHLDYLALFERRDVLEYPLEGELDFSGWDLKKALLLGLTWNPALLEWLTSPIIYREQGVEAEAMRKLFVRALGADALVRHYHGLAHRQYGRHVGQRESVNLKKYFYVIRPAVALLWLRQRPEDAPPMSLPALLDGVALPGDVMQEIARLRERKQGMGEVGTGARIAALDVFCEAQMAWAQGAMKGKGEAASAEMRAEAEALFVRAVKTDDVG